MDHNQHCGAWLANQPGEALARIIVVDDVVSLSYAYYNRPNATAPATMQPHAGMTYLEFERRQSTQG